MGRGDFSGGGTVVTLVEGGTVFAGSYDPAAKARPHRTTRRRTPTNAEINKAELSDAERQRRSERSFISMCAKAYADHKLTETFPTPTNELVSQVTRAGGPIGWLQSSRRRQTIFVECLCRLTGSDIPFGRVWARTENPVGLN